MDAEGAAAAADLCVFFAYGSLFFEDGESRLREVWREGMRAIRTRNDIMTERERKRMQERCQERCYKRCRCNHGSRECVSRRTRENGGRGRPGWRVALEDCWFLCACACSDTRVFTTPHTVTQRRSENYIGKLDYSGLLPATPTPAQRAITASHRCPRERVGAAQSRRQAISILQGRGQASSDESDPRSELKSQKGGPVCRPHRSLLLLPLVSFCSCSLSDG